MVLGGSVGNTGSAGNLPQRHGLNRKFGEGLFARQQQLFPQIAVVIGFLRLHYPGLSITGDLYNVKIILTLTKPRGINVSAVKMEVVMTASQVFQIVNSVALLGWIVLAAGIIFNKPIWRDTMAGQAFPLGYSMVYTALIIFFWARAPGGFDSLAHVQLLFTNPWAALAGWVHYLAFDLMIGVHIAKRVMDEGYSRLFLVALLPLTFLFGPIGYLGFQLTRVYFRKFEVSA